MEREDLERVLQQATTGDADAFGLIVRRFQDMAVGYAYSILGDFQLAEDAAQEAFVQAYQDLWQLRDPNAFPAWFRKLIFKQCDRLTRKRRLEIVPLEVAAAIASGGPDPLEAIEMREAQDRVHEAIRCLADHERAVMTLFYIGEYSQKEIGAFLDVPVTTVKKRLYDARKHLKERMVAMVHDNLQDNRPSRDEQFVKQVFVLGGTLRHDAPSYVERRADRELYEGLTRGEFCYVLTSRQMGKSSLMVRTAVRLRGDGITSVPVDLTAIGLKRTPAEWYRALLDVIARQVDVSVEAETFWKSHARREPAKRWMDAIREVVLPAANSRLALFIDEIDFVRSLPFSVDGLFREIGDCTKKPPKGVECNRPLFCVLGVATAADLIEDRGVTSPDVIRYIELEDFTEAETRPLARLLARTEARGEELMRRVLYWTGGQPYLTQRLCQAVAEAQSLAPEYPAADGQAASIVDRVCGEVFLTPQAQERDDNLLFVRGRLLRSEADLANLLDLYGQVRLGRRVPDDETNPLVSMLRLAGIVRVESGELRIRNRIYAQVFNQDWVQAQLQ